MASRRILLALKLCAFATVVAATALWPRPGPAAANPLTGVAAVAAGGAYTCALTTVGGVKCWGLNTSGQLGDGTTTTPRTIPVDVSGLTNSGAALSAGGRTTCALTTGGNVKCWGDNSQGQLGAETTEFCFFTGPCSTTPLDVAGLGSGATFVVTGGIHSCAVTTGGSLKCWGRNNNGQLGNGTTISPGTTPVDVSGLASVVVGVTAGSVHTCAVTTGGGVKCWGANGDGQLGDGTTTQHTTPTDVSGLTSGVASVTAGSRHTCALTTAGGVKCWGENATGQLGDGTSTNRLTPVDVSGLTSGVAAVAAGSFHTCAVTTAGGVKCWGSNTIGGQLGDGTMTSRNVPVDVCASGATPPCTAAIDKLSGVAGVTAGLAHTCAVTTGGGVKCWGLNGGRLGDGTTIQRSTPVDVVAVVKSTPTSTPTPTPTAALTPTPVAVGGFQAPLESVQSSGSSAGLLAGGASTVAATALALGGAAWSARRRL